MDQSSGHFQSLFFRPPDPKSEKNPVNQLIKKFWPYFMCRLASVSPVIDVHV